jgi:large subunit ribosomal protein L17
MSTSLLLHGRIQTTEAKAKELRSVVEKLITLGKRVPPSSLEGLEGEEFAQTNAKRIHAIRLARKTVQDREALQLLFNDYSERYQGRPGGYTRILKLGRRPGDNAPMALIELVEGRIDEAAVGNDDAGEVAEASSEE